MSSWTEIDIVQNFDSTIYISFSETDDSLQNYCQYLCGQEGSWDSKSKPSSYDSISEVLFQDEAAYFQSENSFLQQQFPQSSNAYVGDYIKNSDSGNFQSYSLSTCLFK